MLVSIISALLLLQVEALPNVFEYEIAKAKSFVRNFELPKENDPSQRKVGSFSWKDCSASSKKGSLVNVKSLSVSPDPLSFPGPLKVATEFIIKQDLTAPIKAELEIKKEEFGVYIPIPCIDNFGSCTYNDVCQLLTPIGNQCPDPLKEIHIDCQCPFVKNNYKLASTEFDITASIIPSGKYEIQANLTKNGAEVACLQLDLSVA